MHNNINNSRRSQQARRSRSALPNPLLTPPEPTPFRSAERDGALPACDGADPELFFTDESPAEAIAICSGCPVRQRCLAYALEHEHFGVWGGTTALERDALRGGPAEATPEDRQVVWAIHQRVNRGDLMPDIAAEHGVVERTLYRWLERGSAA